LPNRRRAETFRFSLGNLNYTATIGYYNDGRVGELFISNTKPSSQSDAYARDAAVVASLCLQFGCSLETLRRAVLRDQHGNPSSPLGVALDLLSTMTGVER
jgi:hypothetical protein